MKWLSNFSLIMRSNLTTLCEKCEDPERMLHQLLIEFPELLLGSYPKIREREFRVLLTLESRDASYLDAALKSLLGRLPDDAVYKVE